MSRLKKNKNHKTGTSSPPQTTLSDMSLAFLQTSAYRFIIKTERKSAAFSFLFDMRVAFSRRRNAAASGGFLWHHHTVGTKDMHIVKSCK